MPGCPMGEVIVENVKRKVGAIEGIKEAKVKLVWDPPWTPARISEDAMGKMAK